MPDINALIGTGFSLDDQGNQHTRLAFLSLRIGLKAFFSTYRVVKRPLGFLFYPHDNILDQDVQFSHPVEYQEAYAETVMHIHHFIELIFKDILRREHPLLATDASSKPLIFHKLLKQEAVAQADQEKLKSVEFSETLKRVVTLVEENRIGNGQYAFILGFRDMLEQLNGLRNRLIHRGTFLLPYSSLDTFVGAYLLPFVVQFMSLPEYTNASRYWKYDDLDSGVDPITLISTELSAGQYDIGKVAMLKELGRAAYAKPLLVRKGATKIVYPEPKERAERSAEVEYQHSGEVVDVLKCPVCGVKSLLVYEEFDTETDPETEELIRWRRYTYQVRCLCCSFEIENHLKNPSEYGLPMEDYWHYEGSD